jgi:uncharacterized protein YgfB (UPF0149 family)
MFSVTFAELESVLAGRAGGSSAGEAHGMLAGGLCASAAFGLDEWVADALAGAGTPELHARDVMGSLYAETADALVQGLMEFEPLLPEDDAPLEQRVAALAAWCAGFLYGFGAGRPLAGELSPEVEEMMRDFTEIARAEVGGSDGGAMAFRDPAADDEAGEDEAGDEQAPALGAETVEENEAAYAELVEYVRAAAQLAYEELAPYRAGPAETP